MGLSCGFLSPTADKGYIPSADNTRSGCRQTWAQTRADAGEFRAHPGLATRFTSVPTTVVARLGASICVSWPKVSPQAPSTFYKVWCPWCSSFLGNMLEMIKSLESHPHLLNEKLQLNKTSWCFCCCWHLRATGHRNALTLWTRRASLLSIFVDPPVLLTTFFFF